MPLRLLTVICIYWGNALDLVHPASELQTAKEMEDSLIESVMVQCFVQMGKVDLKEILKMTE